jgi:predicted transcriptional regulator
MDTGTTTAPRREKRYSVTRAFTIDPRLHAEVSAVAETIDAPYSVIVRWALREWLDRHHPAK